MSQHQFTSHIAPGIPPISWYARLLAQPDFQHDDAQAQAIASMQRLYEELIEFKQKRNRLFGRSLLPSPKVPLGLYFWGGVGRGKSFLMDCFFACVPYQRKRRVHFHAFMQEVHTSLKSLHHVADPLATVAADIAKQTRLLCFDEFHVSDIADAMILGRLFTHLFAHGVVLVATSNYAPDDLYPDGLQRQNFLPAIALLKQHVEVVSINGKHDHRRRELSLARTYLCPINPATEKELADLFQQHATDELPLTLHIDNRAVHALAHARGIIWFSFAELCGGPRAQTDYLWLARRYPIVLLSGIPKMTAKQFSMARRFTWLIDVFYDYRVKLVLCAEVPADQLYTEGSFAQEFCRTASRLTEMQTQAYLALSHDSDAVHTSSSTTLT